MPRGRAPAAVLWHQAAALARCLPPPFWPAPTNAADNLCLSLILLFTLQERLRELRKECGPKALGACTVEQASACRCCCAAAAGAQRASVQRSIKCHDVGGQRIAWFVLSGKGSGCRWRTARCVLAFARATLGQPATRPHPVVPFAPAGHRRHARHPRHAVGDVAAGSRGGHPLPRPHHP